MVGSSPRKSDCSHSLKPCQSVNPDLWVDASTSWGISTVLCDFWYAWALMLGWKADGRDIGWAKSITLELAILILVDHDFHDCRITIYNDNTGIIGTYDKGRS